MEKKTLKTKKTEVKKTKKTKTTKVKKTPKAKTTDVKKTSKHAAEKDKKIKETKKRVKVAKNKEAKVVLKSKKVEKKPKKTVKKANTKKIAKRSSTQVKKLKKYTFADIEKPVFEENNIEELIFKDLNDINIGKQISFEKKKKNKESILIGIIVVLTILLLVCVFLLFRTNASLLDFGSGVEKDVIRALPKEADPIYKETWKQHHDKAFVPDDYVGQIIFESELINEPVLQGNTNETYIRRNYETYNYEVCGPVFMDYICDVNNDQNLILYGHNRSTSVDPDHVMMFSPLHVLEDEANYSENKLIYMAYENRLDIYLVASVYPVKIVEKEDGNQYLVQGEPLYYLDNYSPDQFETYYKTVKQKQFYDTGVELVSTDELLTLQTCYEDKLDKLIVLAKKVGSINYKEN